jgi:hypothetical protein
MVNEHTYNIPKQNPDLGRGFCLLRVVVQQLEDGVELVVQDLKLFVAERRTGVCAFLCRVRAFAAEVAAWSAAFETAALVATILLEAVAAEHWLLSVWFEWNFARRATFSTRCLVHGRWEGLTVTSESATATAAESATIAATKATTAPTAESTTAAATKATTATATKALSAPAKLLKHRYRGNPEMRE